MTEFKPDLLPIKELNALSPSEKEAYQSCLIKKVAKEFEAPNEERFCRCVAGGSSRYLEPLLVSSDKDGVEKVNASLKNLGELGAKGMVISKLCAGLPE